MQAGAYQNGCYVVGVAKGGIPRRASTSLAESCIIAPSGQIIALDCRTEADEVITAEIDLEPHRRNTRRRSSISSGTDAPRSTGRSPNRRARSRQTDPPAQEPPRSMAEFTVNGEPPWTVGDHHEHLLAALRDELRDHLAQGRLFAVGSVWLLHGARRRQGPGVVPDVAGQGRPGRRSPPSRGSTRRGAAGMAAAFAAHGALQCGFCTPGIVMRTKSLLGRDKETTRDDAARHLGAHLCRCTGYVEDPRRGRGAGGR